MKNVLIAGGSGLIGRRLSAMLMEKGYTISILSRTRSSENNVKVYLWNTASGFIEDGAIDNADHIINLAGTGIAEKRWTKKRKAEIISSRVNATKTILDAVKKNTHHIKNIICASAIGYYQKNNRELMAEEANPGNDFLANTVQQWEAANHEFEKIQIRTVIFRFGIVLSLKGGALLEMYKPMKYGIAGYFGNGKQYYSWIHIDDVCRMIIHAIENEMMHGIFNAVAPYPETNKNFMKTLSQVTTGMHLLMPVPPFVIKAVLGEKASIVLDGQKISSDKILNSGFAFHFPDLTNALKNIFHS